MNVLLLIAALVLPSMAPQGAPALPGGSVTGQLISKDGQPVAGVRISAMVVPETNVPIGVASTLVSFVMTDNTGRFRLESVPAGRYYIMAGLLEQPTYYPGVPALTGATAVSVTAGATVTGINFGMLIPAGFAVRGKVIRPPSAPITGVQRVLLYGSNSGTLDSVIAADGTFEFTKVRPGQYTGTVSAGTLTLAQPLSIVVTDKDVAGIEVVLLQTVSITGNMTIEGDGLRPRFQLTMSPFRGGISSSGMTVLPDGSIRGSAPEGEYRLSWSNLPAGYILKSITMGSLDLLTNSLKLQVNTPAAPINVMLGVSSPPPWAKLSGRVVGLKQSSTATPIHLALTGTALAETLDVVVAADGSFEFPRVLPGSYTARFPALPVAYANVVIPSGGASSLEIPVPPLKEVTGRVVIEGLGQIAPRLIFTWNEPAGIGGNSSPAVARPDGTFSVILPESERKVTLNTTGYTVRAFTYGTADLLKEPLKISATSTDEFRVTLVPAATLVGATGVPGLVSGGVIGGVIGGVSSTPSVPLIATTTVPTVVNRVDPPAVPNTSGATPVAGTVAAGNLVSSVRPAYPEAARTARVEGAVIMTVVISKEGNVDSITVVSGDALLRDAALNAVKQWKYKPTVVNGQPVSIQTTVTVNFSLQ